MKRSWARGWRVAWAGLGCVCVGREDGGGRGRAGGRSQAELLSCSGAISGKAPALAPCASSPAALRARRAGPNPHRRAQGMEKKGMCPHMALSHPWFPGNKINKCAEEQEEFCGVPFWGAALERLGPAGARCAPRCPCLGHPPGPPRPCPLLVCAPFVL